MKHLFKILTAVLGAAFITFLVLFILENKSHNNTEDKYNVCLNKVLEDQETLEGIISFSDAMLGFANNTNDYINCLWKAMRSEIYFSQCDSHYELYKNSWNILYDEGLVETFIYDSK